MREIKKYGAYQYTIFSGEDGVAYKVISDEDIETILSEGWEIIHVAFNNNHYWVQCKRKLIKSCNC